MSLCGLGLLSDNLGKILDRARGSALWRPSNSQKLDPAPRRLVLRPGSAERPGFSSPRSVGGFAGLGVQEASYRWALDGSGWRLEGVGLFLEPHPGMLPAFRPGPHWCLKRSVASQDPSGLGWKSEGGGWGGLTVSILFLGTRPCSLGASSLGVGRSACGAPGRWSRPRELVGLSRWAIRRGLIVLNIVESIADVPYFPLPPL